MTDDTKNTAAGSADLDAEALLAKYLAERDKRMEGAGQYLAPNGELAHYLDDPYVGEDTPREPVTKRVEAALIGCGFGNLQAAVGLVKAGIDDFVMIDRAGDVGGVWYWNRYPGVACDVDSYVYFPLLEDMGYMPTTKYASGPEIFEYARSIATKYDLYGRALLRTEISEVRWDESEGVWVISTNRGDEIRARFVNVATGPLQRLQLPAIPGIESFAGHSFHTARWDYAYTGGNSSGGLDKLADKRVGIIGTGATAVQAIPHLGASAKHLYVFQRTPAPVPVRNHQPTDPKWVSTLTPGWHQHRIDNFNSIVNGDLKAEDLVNDGWTELKRLSIKQGPDGNERGDDQYRKQAELAYMQKICDRVDAVVKDKATAESLKPWFGPSCKRPCFHDDYLATFNRPNVTLVDTQGRNIERITPTGVVVNGVEYEIDCLIYATGFDFNAGNMAERNGFEIYGRGGRSLTDKWNEEGISTCFGYQSNGFPNLVFQTAAQGVITTNITQTLGEGAQHFVHLVQRARDLKLRTLEPSVEAEREWVGMIHSPKFAPRADPTCTPGYYNNSGRPMEGAGNAAFYQGNSQKFFLRMRAWRDSGDMLGLERTPDLATQSHGGDAGGR